MASVLAALAQTHRVPRVATVTTVTGSVATVDIGGSDVDATIPTTPAFTLGDGDTVYVLPIGEGTWLVIAAL